MQYRPEIDGLRTLAILPVIFFHAGFSTFSGGFLGVDVFLVISGYLITSIILQEQTEQRFRLVNFYARRARRILPALFFVLWASTVAAWFILSPQQLVDFAHSAMATIGFGANIYFWQHIDYFTGNTDLLPLLHLWSLGIEEQFYFILPLLLLALAAYQRGRLAALALLFVFSFGCALWLSAQHSSAAFYLLPARAWELLAGVGCALYLQRKTQRTAPHWAQGFSALGLLLLVLSYGWLTPHTPHPSHWTLLPVLATVLIILYAKPHTYVARLLSLRPLVWLGLLSYSAYLWHQPLFALLRHVTQQAQFSLTITFVIIIITFVISAVSWRFIEQPFRNRAFLSTKQVFSLSAAVMIITFVLMAVISQQRGVPQRFSELQQILFEQQRLSRVADAIDPCFLAENRDSSTLAEQCKINAQQRSVMLGDSHASALWYGLSTAATPLAKYSASGCAPLLGEEISAWRPFCASINHFNFEEIATKQPEKVYLHANWLLYAQHLPAGQAERIIEQQVKDTLAHLKAIAPQTEVVVIGDVPQWQPSLPSILSRYTKTGLPNADSYLPNASYTELKALEASLQVPTEAAGVRFISLLDLLCRPDGSCRTLVPLGTAGWEPLMWDYGHLSRSGAAFVAESTAGEP